MKSAIEEFKIQGYDLSGVVTSKSASELEKCVWVGQCSALEGGVGQGAASSPINKIACDVSQLRIATNSNNNNNNNNKRPLTPKSMPPAGDEHAKLKT